MRKPLSGTGNGRESSVSEYLSLFFSVLNTLDMVSESVPSFWEAGSRFLDPGKPDSC